jgi:diguanylate cyclase (GGDEF)-like protein
MWFNLIAAALLLATGISTTGWVRFRRRLADSTRERADLANSSLVIEQERRMLELVAQGAPLGEVLNTLTLAIERISPGALCTVMLLDEEHRRYLTAASGPSLSPEYLQAVNGLEIGPEVGACGTAAFLNETVVVSDIGTDPKFALARDFVLGHGLRSCWSQPIRDSGNNVVGTFAIYHRYVAKPRSEELRMARAAAQLAGNAIERIRAGKVLSETARRLSLAERVARFGIWEANFAKSTVTISEGTAAMMELPLDKRILTVDEFDALIHPDDLRALRSSVDTSKQHGETNQNEFRLVLPSGAVRWVRSHWSFELGEGAPTRATGAMIDITKEKNMLVQSQEARATAEAAAGVAREAERLEQDRKTILELVAKDQPLDQIVTAMAAAVSNHLPGSLCSIRIELTEASRISVYPQFPENLANALDRIAIASVQETSSPEPIARLSSDPEWLRFVARCGSVPFPQYRAVPILHNMRPTGLIISFLGQGRPGCPAEEKLLESWAQFASLAVERRGLYEQLSFRAQYDSLTTLLNRASLYDRLDAQIRAAGAVRSPMAVLYLDLDRFKDINDKYGHGAGDKVLQDVARRILEGVRHTDFVARIGGDEFVVILPGVSERKEAGRVADLVMNCIEQPISFSGRELRVGGSVGISIYPEDGVNTDALLKVADEDMYRVKLRHTLLHPALHTARTRQPEADTVSTSSPALLNV